MRFTLDCARLAACVVFAMSATPTVNSQQGTAPQGRVLMRIELESRTYDLGDPIGFRAVITNRNSEPLSGCELTIHATSSIGLDLTWTEQDLYISDEYVYPFGLDYVVTNERIRVSAVLLCDSDEDGDRHTSDSTFEVHEEAGSLKLYPATVPVHQWIVFQAYQGLQDPEIRSEMSSYLETSAASPLYMGSEGVVIPGSWDDDEDAPSSMATALIEGAWEEDNGDHVQIPAINYEFPARSAQHFWNPALGWDAGLDWVWMNFDVCDYLLTHYQIPCMSALDKAQDLFGRARTAYLGSTAEAYYWLGRTAHLLSDMAVPAHTLNDTHVPGFPFYDPDNYEVFTEQPDDDYRFNFRAVTNGIQDPMASYWGDTPTSFDPDLTDLFFSLADNGNNFDSDDVNGEGGAYPPSEPTYWVGGGVFRLARNTIPLGNTVVSVEYRDFLGNLIRGLADHEDYEVVDNECESSIYYYETFISGAVIPPNFVRVLYSDGSWDDFNLLGAPPAGIWDEPLQCIYLEQLESRAIGYTTLLFELFWDRTHAPDVPVLSAPETAIAGTPYVVSWTSTNPNDRYELQEANEPSFTTATTWQVVGTSKSFAHAVSSPTTYFYRVRAREDIPGGATLFSEWSNVDSTLIASAVGSVVASASPNPVNVDLPSTISVTVTDGAGQPVPAGTDVTFSTTYPGFFSGNNCGGVCYSPWTTQTDSNGETWLRFTSEFPGIANITITALDHSTILPIEILDPSANMNVQVTVGFTYGTSTYSRYDVGVVLTDDQGLPVPYQTVDFGFSPQSSGSWQYGIDSCSTSAGGSCDVVLIITVEGEITVLATAGQASGTTTFYAYIGEPSSTPLVPLHTFTLNYDSFGVDFSPDGTTLVAAGDNRDLRAWNTSDWSQKWAVTMQENNLDQVSISPTNTYVAVAADDGVEVRHLSDGSFYCLNGNADGTSVLAHWTSNTSYAETSWEKVYRHTSVCATGTQIATMPADHGFEEPSHLDYCPSRGWIAACTDEGTMFVWNTSGGLITQQGVAPGSNAYDTDFSSDCSKIAAVGTGAVKVFNTSTWASTSYSAQALGTDKWAVKFIDNDTKLAVGGLDKIEILDVVGGSSFAIGDVDFRAVEMAWNPTTEELAVATESGKVHVFRPLVPPDTLSPLINITYPQNGMITDEPSLTTNGRVTDQTGVSVFTINGVSVTPDGEGYFTHTLSLVEGANTITYFAEDPLDHASTELRTVTLVVDHIPPVISNTSVTPLSGYAGTVFHIQSTVIDGDTGVASVTATIRDSASAIVASVPMTHAGSNVYVCTADSTGAEPDVYTIDITAVDSSPQANQQTEYWVAVFEVLAPDITPPAISNTAVTPLSGVPGTVFSIQTTVADASGIASVTATVRKVGGGFSQALPMALVGGGVYGVPFVSTPAPVGSYVVDITAVDSSPNSNQQTVMAAAAFEIVMPLPGAFSKVAPANGATNQPTSLSLTWSTSTDATSYEYCIDTSSNSTCDASWNNVGNVTSATLSGLVAGTTYSWQVRAVNGQGNTQANGGTWWTFTTQALPGVFSKVTPANGASNQPTSLTLTWGTSTDATSYEYCIDTSNNSACDASWSNVGNVTSAVPGGLVVGTTYSWQVPAVNAQGNTQANGGTWWTFTTLDTQPDLPFADGFESGDTSAWSATVP